MMSCYRVVTYTEFVTTSNSKEQPSFDDCLFVLLQRTLKTTYINLIMTKDIITT